MATAVRDERLGCKGRDPNVADRGSDEETSTKGELLMRRGLLITLLATLVAASAAGAREAKFPTRIALPNGWNPEGIAISPGGTFYVGSIAGVNTAGSTAGDIYRGNVKTGTGAPFIDAPAGRAAIGVEFDRGRLFVAGGNTGDGYVYDARTRATLRTYNFADSPPATFVNDVVATRTAAYYTDSNRPVLYRVALGPNGALAATFQTLQLTGDYVHAPGQFNLNGIDATADGKTLVAVQTFTGKLFTVDPQTGTASEIDVGEPVTGDGLLLDGRTLYVVEREADTGFAGITTVRLSPDLSSGRVVSKTPNAGFAVPTTIDEFGNRLYAVNARFGTAVTPTTQYWLTGLRKP
jgi:sugar lactone lactonase YvrE